MSVNLQQPSTNSIQLHCRIVEGGATQWNGYDIKINGEYITRTFD